MDSFNELMAYLAIFTSPVTGVLMFGFLCAGVEDGAWLFAGFSAIGLLVVIGAAIGSVFWLDEHWKK